MRLGFVVSLVVASICWAHPAWADHFQQGHDLLENGNYNEAIAEFKKAIRQKHTNGAVRKATHTGITGLKMLGDFTASLVSLGEVDGIFSYSSLNNPSDRGGRAACASNIAICYCNLRDYKQAQKWALKALKLDSSVDIAHLTLGRIQTAKHNDWNAIDEFNQELSNARTNRQRGFVYINRADSYDQLGMTDKALEDRKRAADLDDRFLSMDKVKEAVDELQRRKAAQETTKQQSEKKAKDQAEREYLQKLKQRKEALQGGS